MPDHHQDYQFCDLHHLIILLIFASAIVAFIGIGVVLLEQYFTIGFNALHFRPEQLGNYGTFKLAFIFNGSLIIASTCMFIAMIGLMSLPIGGLTKLVAWIGIYSSICLFMLGVLPLNVGHWHFVAHYNAVIATTLLGCTSLLAGIMYRAYFSKFLMLCSFLLLFFSISHISHLDISDPQLLSPHVRHDEFCLDPVFAWCLVITHLLWDIALALKVRKLVQQHFSQ
ncbi:MAG: hypothetical protein ACRCT7_17180 [Shewanella sp.]